MNHRNRNQLGFGHVVTVLLIAGVLAIVAFVGVKVADMNSGVNNPSNSLPFSSTTVPKQIKTKADLQQAQRALDTSTAPDPNVLNTDLKNLL